MFYTRESEIERSRQRQQELLDDELAEMNTELDNQGELSHWQRQRYINGIHNYYNSLGSSRDIEERRFAAVNHIQGHNKRFLQRQREVITKIQTEYL